MKNQIGLKSKSMVPGASLDLLAAAVASNPCPPVPLIGLRGGGQEQKHEAFCNSHHLFAQAMMHSMQRENKQLDERRKNAQRAATRELLRKFRQPSQGVGGKDCSNLYDAARSFTVAYMESFSPGTTLEFRFAHWDQIKGEIAEKNPIVRAAAQHLAGMLYYDADGAREFKDLESELDKLPFHALLVRYAEVHRARGDKQVECVY